MMFIATLCLHAESVSSQSAKVSLKQTDAKLENILNNIESQTDYLFLYNQHVDVNQKVSVDATDKPLSTVLNDMFADKNISYSVDGLYIVLSDKKHIASANQTAQVSKPADNKKKITGVIFDDMGETIIGASVVEKDNPSNGTISNADGAFELMVKNNATLIVSYVGFSPQEIAVANKTNLKITMADDVKMLDDIVVVGYGTQRKSSITGSVAALDVDKMKDITTPNVANMLQGKVAGVVATPLSGKPGESVSIRVRGIGSLGGNMEPLWVIDGVVGGSQASLNPNDIEAISVLKDGSATALYGSRGANGVILVTTKQGKLGMSQVDASIRLGVSTLQKGKLRMMNGAEYYDYSVTAAKNAGKEIPSHLQPYLKDMNTDWWDIATQNALTQNYNIGYRYGSDKVRSYLSGDYYKEEGTIKGYDLQRFTLRANNDYIVNNRLTLKSKISGSYQETDDQQHSLVYYSYSPWDTPYDANGNLKTGKEGTPTGESAINADPRNHWYSDGGYNYLYDRDMNWTKGRRVAIDLGLGFDYKIFDFLTFESNNRFAYSDQYYNSYTDPSSLGGAAKKGTVSEQTQNYRTLYGSQMLRFLKTFNDLHEINAFLAYEYDSSNYWYHKGESSNIFPGNEVIEGGVDDHKVNSSRNEYKNAAYFFNGNYAFDQKYLFQASFRYDGSSRFGSNKRWAPFWSVGGGWNMHKEDFIKNLGFIDELKPRISYGITGNQPSGAYEWSTAYDTTKEYGNEVAFMTNYRGNPNLSWEETGTFDFGLDVRLFNRVNLTFDAYVKKVKNLIYLEHLSAVSGFNRRKANDGKMENKGFEITITPELIRTKDIYWDVSFNLGYNANKITYLPKDANQLVTQAIVEGYTYRTWYMREWAGVDTMTGDPLWFVTDKETGEKTVTGDYNKATLELLDSSSLPKYNGAINTSFTWKGLTMNANFTFSAGAKIYNGMRAGSLDRDGARITQPPMKFASGWSRWEKPGDIATHPRLIDGDLNNSSGQSTRYLENGDFFKLKTLSLTYALPKKWLEPAGIKDLSVSVGGENLFTITKFTGVDPEVLLSSRYDGTTSASGNNILYPTVRRFTMGLNLRF